MSNNCTDMAIPNPFGKMQRTKIINFMLFHKIIR